MPQFRTSQIETLGYPSFTIVFETENLASVELTNLYRSLNSLVNQDISPQIANEFLIIDSGDAPEEVIQQISAIYTWVTIKKVVDIEYYEAKMLGANFATGDIIIFCDSDCEYETNWLREILGAFKGDIGVNIVAGETSTLIRNPYELAIAMHYIFPRFTKQSQLYSSNCYFLNAVAFRRNFLLKHPIPVHLPLYRGKCRLHSYYLFQLKGYTIWKNPKARALHEPPTLSFTIWRYLLMGRDHVIKEYIKENIVVNHDLAFQKLDWQPSFTLWQKIYGIINVILNFNPFRVRKIMPVLREDPYRLIFLPISIPIMFLFELIYTIGQVISYIKPNLLLHLYHKK